MTRKNQHQPLRRKSLPSRPARIRGRGDYTTEVQSISDPARRLEAKIDHLERSLVKKNLTKLDAASTIGRTLGNFVNQGDLGAYAASSLAKYFGHGDYRVKSNSLMAGDTHVGATFHKDGPRGTRITEREFIGDIRSGSIVDGSTIFNSRTFVINPTNAELFPWLSRLAPLYDQWQPNGIVIEFVSTSSEYNGSSQALGTIIMATDYDPYDTPFASKPEMENSDYACSTKPALSLVHGIECAQSERPSKILYTDLLNGAPKTSTSLGSFQVATQGMSTAGVSLGELWISYDITFYKKQLMASSSTIPGLSAIGSSGNGDPLIADAIITANGGNFTLTTEPTGIRVSLGSPTAGTRFLVAYYRVIGVPEDYSNLVSPSGLVGCTVLSGRIGGWIAGSEHAGITDVTIEATGGPLSFLTLKTGESSMSSQYTFCVTQMANDNFF